MNLIAELGERHKVAKIQIRLIALEMERLGLDDKFGMDRQQQENLFVETTTRILNVPARAVSELLCRQTLQTAFILIYLPVFNSIFA